MNQTKKQVRLSRVQTYILYFCICFLWVGLWKPFMLSFTFRLFCKRGFLYGPLCPIYGYGAFNAHSILDKYKHKIYIYLYMLLLFFLLLNIL